MEDHDFKLSLKELNWYNKPYVDKGCGQQLICRAGVQLLFAAFGIALGNCLHIGSIIQLLLFTAVNNCILLQDYSGYITFVTKLNQDS